MDHPAVLIIQCCSLFIVINLAHKLLKSVAFGCTYIAAILTLCCGQFLGKRLNAENLNFVCCANSAFSHN